MIRASSGWTEFRHEAMATEFSVSLVHADREYARQAAAAAWREADRLESELSRFVESSDIAQANRLAPGESVRIGHDALQCLLIAVEVCVATDHAFDIAYASERGGVAATAPLFTLDPEQHILTSRAARLHLDLGAIGKGYALDVIAAVLKDWEIGSACLQSGGSTALLLDPPAGMAGWPVGIGEGATYRTLDLAHAALSGSGIAVKGEHLIDPRIGRAASRVSRTWALAPTAATSDALSTAFFVMSDAAISSFCAAHPEIGAAIAVDDNGLTLHGALSPTDRFPNAAG